MKRKIFIVFGIWLIAIFFYQCAKNKNKDCPEFFNEFKSLGNLIYADSCGVINGEKCIFIHYNYSIPRLNKNPFYMYIVGGALIMNDNIIYQTLIGSKTDTLKYPLFNFNLKVGEKDKRISTMSLSDKFFDKDIHDSVYIFEKAFYNKKLAQISVVNKNKGIIGIYKININDSINKKIISDTLGKTYINVSDTSKYIFIDYGYDSHKLYK